MTVQGNPGWNQFSTIISGSLLIEYLEYSVANKFVNHGTCHLCVLRVCRSNYERGKLTLFIPAFLDLFRPGGGGFPPPSITSRIFKQSQ